MIRIPGGSKCLVSFARIAEILDQHHQEAAWRDCLPQSLLDAIVNVV